MCTFDLRLHVQDHFRFGTPCMQFGCCSTCSPPPQSSLKIIAKRLNIIARHQQKPKSMAKNSAKSLKILASNCHKGIRDCAQAVQNYCQSHQEKAQDHRQSCRQHCQQVTRWRQWFHFNPLCAKNPISYVSNAVRAITSFQHSLTLCVREHIKWNLKCLWHSRNTRR